MKYHSQSEIRDKITQNELKLGRRKSQVADGQVIKSLLF